jgi:hypothetical protein
MNPTITRILALASSILATACATAQQGPGDDAVRSAPVTANATAPAGGTLVVEGRNGHVAVSRDAGLSDVRVTAEIRCAGTTQEEADARARATKLVAERAADGALRVHVEFPPFPGAPDRQRHPGDAANIDVRAPRVDGMQLSTVNGHVLVTGLGGALQARTANGGIRIEGHAGPVQATTSNGPIQATGIGLPAELVTSNGGVQAVVTEGATGAVDVRTSNGSVKLELPASWAGHVDASTSNGRVTMEGSGRATATTSDRTHGTMDLPGTAPAKATIATSNGSVHVRAAAAPAPASNAK